MPVDGAPGRVLMTADAVGGVWDYALELTTAFVHRGVEVTLATMGPRPSPAQRAALRDLPRTTLVESDYRLEWMVDADRDVEAAGGWLLAVARECGAELVHLNGYAHAAVDWPVPALVVAHSCVWSWWSAVHGGAPPAEWQAYHDRVRKGSAAASAIALPRSRTSTIACSAVITRAPAAAVSSPTLWPATAPMRANASAGCGKRSRAAMRPVATSSGWAILVSRIVSASASVP